MIQGIAWAGIIILVQFTFWEGNLFAEYYNWLVKKDKWWTKIVGACTVCTGFWWGFGYAFLFHIQHYEVFVGVSEGMLVLYTALLAKWFK